MKTWFGILPLIIALCTTSAHASQNYQDIFGIKERFIFNKSVDSTLPPHGCTCFLETKCLPTKGTSTQAIADALTAQLSPLEKELKSEEELDAYFLKYRQTCSKKYIEKFYSEYKKYVKAAAQAYSLPYAFLACLLFKESKFKNNAVSSLDARGLGQFMSNTTTTISAMIKTSHRPETQKEKYIGIHDELTVKIKNNIPLSLREKGDYGEASTKVQYYELTENWDEYFRLLKTDPDYEKNYGEWTKTYNKEHGSPSVFSHSVGTTLPPHSIGATGYWLSYISSEFHRSFPDTEVKTAEDEISKLLLIAAGYNMGPGSLNKHARKNGLGKNNIGEVSAALKYSNLETASFEKSIENCMRKGVDTGPMLIDRKNLKLKPSISSAEMCKDDPLNEDQE